MAVAVGLAVARSALAAPVVMNGGAFGRRLIAWGTFLSAVALVEGLALLASGLRRRGPEAWGVGRRTWAGVAAVVAFHSVERIIDVLIHGPSVMFSTRDYISIYF